MEEDAELKSASRRVLFPDAQDSGRGRNSDIPGAGRSASEAGDKHTRVKITINLDGDVVRQFKERAVKEGRAYQSLINQVLREYLQGSTAEIMAKEVAEILGRDESFLQLLRKELGETPGGGEE